MADFGADMGCAALDVSPREGRSAALMARLLLEDGCGQRLALTVAELAGFHSDSTSEVAKRSRAARDRCSSRRMTSPVDWRVGK